jgi:hypothetical protein
MLDGMVGLSLVDMPDLLNMPVQDTPRQMCPWVAVPAPYAAHNNHIPRKSFPFYP